jgi:phage N-6-adenine-methyltransferase
MSDIRAMLSSDRMDWETPPELFAWISEKYGPFDLDAAATAENALCATYFTPEDDGLAQSWGGLRQRVAEPPLRARDRQVGEEGGG